MAVGIYIVQVRFRVQTRSRNVCPNLQPLGRGAGMRDRPAFFFPPFYLLWISNLGRWVNLWPWLLEIMVLRETLQTDDARPDMELTFWVPPSCLVKSEPPIKYGHCSMYVYLSRLDKQHKHARKKLAHSVVISENISYQENVPYSEPNWYWNFWKSSN